MKTGDMIGVFVLFICAVWGALMAGQSIGYFNCQEEAVKNGVGEWVIEYENADFSDVKRSFRWKLPKN